MTSLSPAEQLATLPPAARAKAKKQLREKLGPQGVANLKYNWRFWARPNQLEPAGDWWFVWTILAGRGWGKTRVGAEFIKQKVMSGEARYPRLIARTSGDIRNTMIEGESGLLSICPPDWRPVYKQTTGEIVFPNGVTALCYSAEEPDRLRGPQCDVFWADEIGSWGSTQGRANARLQQLTWDTHVFGTRLGARPHGVITTTPSDTPVIRELLARVDKDVVLTCGASHENRNNLAESFWDTVIAPYEGTALGRQEIYAEVLDLSGEGFIDPGWIRNCVASGVFAGRDAAMVAGYPIDLGVDVAGRTRGGDDTCLIAARDGGDAKRLEGLKRFNGVDTMQTVGEVKAMIEATRARSVRIDDTAIGNGVSDRLRELKRESLRTTALWKCEIVPINFGSRAFNETRFADIRSEMWWAAGEALRKGAVELPGDLELQRELSRPSMLKTSNGRLRLESKDSMRARGIESPDAADAACLALYPRGWVRSHGTRIRLIPTD